MKKLFQVVRQMQQAPVDYFLPMLGLGLLHNHHRKPLTRAPSSPYAITVAEDDAHTSSYAKRFQLEATPI